MNKQEYYEEVSSIATQIPQDYDLTEVDLYQAVSEVCDGHRWIIYYSYNAQVLLHSDHHQAIQDVYSNEDLGQVVCEGGIEGLQTSMAFFALQEDVLKELHKNGVTN